jgi:hypothetical protein
VLSPSSPAIGIYIAMEIDTGNAPPAHRRSKRRPKGVHRGLRGMPKQMNMRKKSRHMRRWLLQHPWIRPMLAFNFAATVIQTLARGRIARNRMTRRKKPKARIRHRGKQLDRYLIALEFYKTTDKAPPSWLDSGFSTWCAVRIQSWYRMIKAYRQMQYILRGMIYQIASIEIQISWRDYFHRRREQAAIAAAGRSAHHSPAAKHRDAKKRASVSIQSAWRRFCYKRVYRYFRDLIMYKLKGAPNELLRNIIPTEVGLLDKAAGVHVRFRLGGRIFPPSVFFKIFTHRPLCDVNAFAPRNYVKERPCDPSQLQQKDSVVVANGNFKNGTIRVGGTYFGAKITTTNVTGEGWYQRKENNAWRSISTMIVTEALSSDDADSVPYGLPKPVDKTAKPFHYSRLVRTIDIVRDRKKRRREWMLKAYLMDSEKTHAELDGDRRRPLGPESYEPSCELVRAASREHGGMNMRDGGGGEERDMQNNYEQNNYEQNKYNDLMDDDLINWSLALDFELYNKDWSHIGMSVPSDADPEKVYKALR